MRSFSTFGLAALSVTTSLILAACGGGGGAATQTGGAAAPTENSDFAAVVLSDNYSSSWRGDGSGFGGDNGGVADSVGSAGDGEFFQLTGGLPSGAPPASTTLTWKILRSQYGQQNTTGTLTVQRNVNNSGGYVVTAVNGKPPRPTQSNIFISLSGIVTGTLPLNIAGTVRDAAFSALRLKDSIPSATADFSAMAGTYAYGYFNADVGTGNNRYANGGWLRISANGTGRMCDGATSFSATCPRGLDVVATYANTDKNIVRLTQSPTQSLSIPTDLYDQLNALVVAKPVSIGGVTGYTMSTDVLSWDSRNTTKPARTGISYASRAFDATGGNVVQLNSSSLAGVYNIVFNHVNPAYSGYMYASIALVGSTYRGRSSVDQLTPLTCDSAQGNQLDFPATTTNGVFVASGVSDPTNKTYVIYTDADSFLYVPNGNTGLGVARRMNNDPKITPVANCQPF